MSNSSFYGVASKSFITISHDNRLCLFDVEKKTETRAFVEKKHLAHTYTCYDWLGGKQQGKDYFAAGASDGSIVVWDLVRGVVIRTIEHGSVPSAVSFSLDAETLYVASSEPAVARYNVKTGEKIGSIKCGKKEVQRMVCNPKAALMAISSRSTVKLVDLSSTTAASSSSSAPPTGNEKKKCEGSFSGGLNCLQFSPCGKFLAAASQNSREVVVYKLGNQQQQDTATPRKRTSSSGSDNMDAEADGSEEGKVGIYCTIPIPGICKSVQLLNVRSKNSHGIKTAALYLCALLEDSTAAVLVRCDSRGNSSNGSEVQYSMCDVTADAAGGILTASIESTAEGVSVHFACALGGSKAAPSFQVVSCEDSAGSMLSSVALAQTQAKAGSSQRDTAAGAGTAVPVGAPAVFGAMDAAAQRVPIVTATAASSSSGAKSKRAEREEDEDDDAEGTDGDVDFGMSPGGTKRVRFMLDDIGAGAGAADAAKSANEGSPLTLEKRLELLSSGALWDDAADEHGVNTDDNEDAEGGEQGHDDTELSAAPTSDSLVTLLQQALNSSDDALLEQCLSCTDEDVIEETARRLPVACVVTFLRKLVSKFEKRPSRGMLLTKWLARILRYRMSYLISVPNLAGQLAGLSQMLENRLSSYSRLASLAGRLDLLMGAVGAGAGVTGVSEDEEDLAVSSPNGVMAIATSSSDNSNGSAASTRKGGKQQRRAVTVAYDV